MTNQTVFTFEITRSASVKVEIFTASGRLVKRYAEDGVLDAGYNEIPAGGTWDGTDENNEAVAGDIYLYKITAVPSLDGEKTATATGKLVIKK